MLSEEIKTEAWLSGSTSDHTSGEQETDASERHLSSHTQCNRMHKSQQLGSIHACSSVGR